MHFYEALPGKIDPILNLKPNPGSANKIPVRLHGTDECHGVLLQKRGTESEIIQFILKMIVTAGRPTSVPDHGSSWQRRDPSTGWAGTAGAGGMAPPTSTRISARLKRGQGDA